MPRYFIQTDDGRLRHHDDVGMELAGPEDARKAALAALPDMAREHMPDGDRRVFMAIVRDEDDRVVYTASLSLIGQWLVDHH